jgi:predicted RNase H-like HicB family nuclease
LSAYAVIIEGEQGSYSAYVPDLPGCVATGRTVEQAEERIRDAIRLHIDSLRSHGELVPKSSTAAVRLVDVA